MIKPTKQWFEQFLWNLENAGWKQIFSLHGWDLKVDTSQTALNINRSLEGFDEFAIEGDAAICPGDPSLSLLYHALMHPGITHEAISYWPDLEEIDALENYIYSLIYVDAKQLAKLTPVVMAYEYRTTQRTPHKQHADLVFSRTGVGRVGTHEPEYSVIRRCFNTTPDDSSLGTRVQPARYGVFLCKKKRHGEGLSLQGKKHSGDEDRIFYEPVLKIFDGMKLEDHPINLHFESLHQNDKLNRMITKGKLKIDSQFNLDSPPFLYRSDRDNFTEEKIYAGNIVVWRKPQTMCRPAEQDSKIVTFEVPKESQLEIKSLLSRFKNLFFFNNRRYTSLRVGKKTPLVVLDYALNAFLTALGSDRRVFLSPRHAGEFTNIRHILNHDGEIVDLNFLPVSEFKSKLSQGGYQAVLYEDPVAEGYVKAIIESHAIKKKQAKPAYSLMTAPDFMPRVGNIDIYTYEKLFVTGGPRALCEGRLPVNLRLKYANSDTRVFSSREKTVTAITAKPRHSKIPQRGLKEYNNTHYLSDEASDVFAPGWDVTYDRDSLFSSAYYHTAGLGAPFLEDVKLCAAANGMWPAASPDAARTFRRKTRTALPLTDEEIGLAPDSTLAMNDTPTASGWDGEYGPFIELIDGKLQVNYASIERSDYISNYTDNRFDFSRLRNIDRIEAKLRLSSLESTYKKILTGTKLSNSPFWLVSFTKVKQWEEAKTYLNLPEPLWSINDLARKLTQHAGPGYFYIFAKYAQESITPEEPSKRRIQPVDSLHFVKAVAGEPPVVYDYAHTEESVAAIRMTNSRVEKTISEK